MRDAPEPGRLRVTFAVDDWIRPAEGGARVDLDVADPRVDGLGAPWDEGPHALIVVPAREDLIVDVFEAPELAERRAEIEALLPVTGDVPCPPPWRETP
ncbi:hypothetical protein [Streptomyces sp. PT12]|uniref:hypothetical protein n=1 Tax=Streptomyces sp. PT12 TaxID=1510197 RepID=UPI0011BE2296|nr:hypothetical protein [Streptomyces sp. PT12]